MDVTVGTIQVQLITQNAGIFVGENYPIQWSTQLKINSAGGTVAGDGNILYRAINVIDDPDMIDSNWVNIEKGESKEEGPVGPRSSCR
ncbi:exoribonuclease II [Croceifilum oryzae]|uniref:Exoribonuclease II n=1 Tax=Croceifilum oryzae TaxID=1553429 RepID=A0AAJ1TF19_9BACL|nr:spore germination protein [Croceifilum oryzae]MDQ0417693.1 exoribonuclease II [Croceifilum oryzae]